jgi:hypothetical protein
VWGGGYLKTSSISLKGGAVAFNTTIPFGGGAVLLEVRESYGRAVHREG